MPARPPSPNPAHVPGAKPWGVHPPDPRPPDADKPPPPPPMTCAKCGRQLLEHLAVRAASTSAAGDG